MREDGTFSFEAEDVSQQVLFFSSAHSHMLMVTGVCMCVCMCYQWGVMIVMGSTNGDGAVVAHSVFIFFPLTISFCGGVAISFRKERSLGRRQPGRDGPAKGCTIPEGGNSGTAENPPEQAGGVVLRLVLLSIHRSIVLPMRSAISLIRQQSESLAFYFSGFCAQTPSTGLHGSSRFVSS